MTSKCLKFIKHGLSVVGFATGVGFTAYGAILLEQSGGGSVSSITTIIVGALLTLNSCCFLGMDAYNNYKIEKLLDGLEKQNTALRESVSSLQILMLTQKEQTERQKEILEESQHNVETLSQRTAELQKVSLKYREMSEQYREQLNRNAEISAQMEKEIEHLKMLNFDSESRVQELQQLVMDQKSQIVQLAEQAQNLNKLQRQSVKMIQQLALYGNNCKEVGMSLKDVSKELRETDESLGLTATEMQQQLGALEKIMQALQKTDASLRLHLSPSLPRRKKVKSKSSGALLSVPLGEDNNV